MLAAEQKNESGTKEALGLCQETLTLQRETLEALNKQGGMHITIAHYRVITRAFPLYKYIISRTID